MTTVGYGDFAPQSLAGYITVSFLSVVPGRSSHRLSHLNSLKSVILVHVFVDFGFLGFVLGGIEQI